MFETVILFAGMGLAAIGIILALLSLGWRRGLIALALAALLTLALFWPWDRIGFQADWQIDAQIAGTVALIGLAFLRLGWLAHRDWWPGGALAGLGLLGALIAVGLLGWIYYPGSGLMANLGYLLGVVFLALPAAVGFSLGLGIGLVTRDRTTRDRKTRP